MEARRGLAGARRQRAASVPRTRKILAEVWIGVVTEDRIGIQSNAGLDFINFEKFFLRTNGSPHVFKRNGGLKVAFGRNFIRKKTERNRGGVTAQWGERVQQIPYWHDLVIALSSRRAKTSWYEPMRSVTK